MQPHTGDRPVDTRQEEGTALLITGAPGVGKTTVVQRALRQLPLAIRGFYTEEIRQAGVRRGFRLISFDGRKATFAHVDIQSPFRVGKYGVDVGLLEEWAAELLGPDSRTQIYVVDEIGKMECLSRQFVAAVQKLLDDGRLLIATVALRGGGLIAEIKQRPDVTLWHVTRTSRESLPERVAEWTRRAVHGGTSR